MQRDANGRAQVAAPSAAGDIAQLATVMGVKWDLLQEYTVAGSYTFTAPDVYGDGREYEIGVFMVGGGGSGGAAKGYSASVAINGGGSGHSKTIFATVTPGNNYTVVVGAGGEAVVKDSFSGAPVPGNNGGTSSFNGVVAEGGGAGGTVGADGGQGSDVSDSSRLTTPWGGVETTYPTIGNVSKRIKGGFTIPLECINPFTQKRMLAAGGYAFATSTSSKVQSAVMLDDGLMSSAGAAAYTSSTTDDTPAVTAMSPTSPGCGGGAAVSFAGSGQITPVSPCTSAAGADGAVFIYVRRIPA
jgi:hypothetical protein